MLLNLNPTLPVRKEIQWIREHCERLDHLLGKPVPDVWTPIGQWRDPETADDPVLADELMKELLAAGRKINDISTI